MFRDHKPRDRYLDLLAREPLFRGVPRPLVVVLGRIVDRIELAPGDVVRCDLSRESLLVADGLLLLTEADGRAVAAIGPNSAIGCAGNERSRDSHRVVAATSARAFVIARRELDAVAAMAPAVAEALVAAAAPFERPTRQGFAISLQSS